MEGGADDVPVELSTSTTASTSKQTLCEVCSSGVSKYTCPRCSMKICSLDCTQAHKTTTGCNGIRDKVKYVPMTEYSDIAMWHDLAFLREVGEKVKDWGGALNLPSAEAISRKERQLGKGKQREDNHNHSNKSSTLTHDRLKTLTPREIKLRRSLLQSGIEILFMPKEMEKHKNNKSGFNVQKKKLLLTVSFHVLDSDKKRTLSNTSHNNDLDTRIHDLLKKSLPDFDASKHVLLLPVPVRPVVFSRTAPPLEPAKKPEELFNVPVQLQASRPLPRAHSSLPMKPSWLDDSTIVEEGEEVTLSSIMVKENTPEPEPPVPRRELPKAQPREVWLVSSTDTLKEALKGVSILEWPEFEAWPEELARKEIKEDRMVYAERRQVYDRDDWRKKREAEDQREENGDGEEEDDRPSEAKRAKSLDVSSDSSDVSSDSSDSSDSEEEDNKMNKKVEEHIQQTPVMEEVPKPAALFAPASAGLPPRPNFTVDLPSSTM